MEQITIIGRELLPYELNEISQSTASVYCLTEKSPVDGATVISLFICVSIVNFLTDI